MANGSPLKPCILTEILISEHNFAARKINSKSNIARHVEEEPKVNQVFLTFDIYKNRIDVFLKLNKTDKIEPKLGDG